MSEMNKGMLYAFIACTIALLLVLTLVFVNQTSTLRHVNEGLITEMHWLENRLDVMMVENDHLQKKVENQADGKTALE